MKRSCSARASSVAPLLILFAIGAAVPVFAQGIESTLCLRSMRSESIDVGRLAAGNTLVLVLYNESCCRDCFRCLDSALARIDRRSNPFTPLVVAPMRSSMLARREVSALLGRLMPGLPPCLFACGAPDPISSVRVLPESAAENGDLLTRFHVERTPAVLLVSRLTETHGLYLSYNDLFHNPDGATVPEVLSGAIARAGRAP